MSAVQLKTCADIVVKVPDFPVPHIVAVLAFSAEFLSVYVVVLVAAVTGCGSFVAIELPCMATLADGCAMFANERKFRIPIVIEGHGFPALFAMTFLAFLSEGGAVDVVFLVAGVAVGRCLVFVQRVCVAAVAFRLLMIAPEGVRGVAIMFEQQDFPVPFGVAAFAGFTVAALMSVIFLVASVAVGRGLIFIQMPLMTGVAFGRAMSSPQGVL